MDDDRAPFLLGVAGGSGSGKTTIADHLGRALGLPGPVNLKLDSYYRDRSDLDFESRTRINYDHPDAFDWDLLIEHVDALSRGHAVEVPTYDFTRHVRAAETEQVEPAPIVVVEGILVLDHPELLHRYDLRVFVDTDADVRFIRRLQRDVMERGRTTESVIEQYLTTVRPSHLQFVEPSKRNADVIIPHGGMNSPAIDVLVARMRELLRSP